jgi:hypothetical protein
MASLRRKYQGVESKDAPPVTTTPQETAAKLPEPVADAKPPEPAVESSPAEEAGKLALKQRLAEMQQAENLQRAAIQQHALAAEPPEPQDPIEQAIAHLPERAKR